MKPLLTLKNISFSYNGDSDNKTDVLDNINLTISQGEIVSVIGPNGCGKSTLLAIICGLIVPEHGCIIIDGSHVGHMFSSGNLFEWRTAYRNIYNSYTKANSPTFYKSNPYPSKDLFLHNRYDVNSGKCSGCDMKNCLKRRAALIKTLSFEPDLLLLDEPFLPFDTEGRLTLAWEIRNMLIKEQKTALLATNDMEEAVLFADKIIILTDKPASIIRQIEIPSSIHSAIRQEKFQMSDYKDFTKSPDYLELVYQIQNSLLTS